MDEQSAFPLSWPAGWPRVRASERQAGVFEDKFDAVWKNMRAIQKTIEALRGIERWGSSQLLDRACAGFAALPERSETESCWAVLGVPVGAAAAAVQRAYRDLARAWHPDAGGSHELMTKLNRARDEALTSVGGQTR